MGLEGYFRKKISSDWLVEGIFVIMASTHYFPLFFLNSRAAAPLPLSFPFSFFSSPSFHARHSFLPFLSFLLPSSHRRPHTETETETQRERERERESCCMEEEKRERRNGFLEKLRPVGINGADQHSSVVRWS
jgi:hypothetical protein